MTIKDEKVAKVQEIKDKISRAQSVILADYRGLTVEEDTELRHKLREAGVEYKVLKNTLTSIAAKEAGYEELDKYLAGPTSFAFSYDDPTVPARILSDFSREHKKMEFKAGIVQGKVLGVDMVKELASIPSKEVLIAKLLGSFKAPLSNFAYLVNAIKEKKEQEA